ncbi:putative reverse transcriptase domain-containing protein [Tanacetum coccineum]
MPTIRQGANYNAIEQLIARRVAKALDSYEANKNSGNVNINGDDNGNGSHDSGSGSRITLHTARGCTYKEFLNCQPLNFKGTKGAVRLAQWFEKMESVFNISNCTVECQVKYATCTLLNGELTWWNSYVRSVGHDAAYEMSWKDLMKMMTEVYCPRNEMHKFENELWNLTVKGTDVVGYTQRFQELALLCPRMVPEESDKIANSLMDQKVRAYAARQADNKKRMDNNPRDNHAQQLPYKRQNVDRAYTAGPSEKKEYAGTLPLCNKCKYHHNGPYAAKCANYKRVGHLTGDWHYKSDCLKLKNQNYGNQSGNGEVRGRVYALGGGQANLDSNVVMGTFLLNNRYASILFDTGADRSFVSTTFSSLIDIAQSALDNSYDVKLADGKIIGVDTIIRSCTLNLLNHPFNIDLMLVELGSFDVIIGMDRLSKYHAVIVCDDKIVRIPFGNETLIVRGDGSNNGNES